MISQRALNYARVLNSMEITEESVLKAKQLLSESNELVEALVNPVIKQQEKASVIDTLFEKEIGKFLKVLCENNSIGDFEEIFNAYEEILLGQKNIIKAKLSYAVKPEEEELNQIKKTLCDKYKKTGVFLELEEDASLIGGYVLYVGDIEYNKSIKGALSEMQKTLIGR